MNQSSPDTATTIRALAEKHGVVYGATAVDELASHMTRLAGDDVQLDSVELLLIELNRTGHLSRPEMLQLQFNYLQEARL